MTADRLTSVARPYVAAAFSDALVQANLSAWRTLLENAARVTADAQVRTLLRRPAVDWHKLADFYIDILQPLDAHQTNFMRVLAANRRLIALPEMARLFRARCEAYEKTQTVTVTSAVALDEIYLDALAMHLQKRLQQQVKLVVTVDDALLGGIIVTAGDQVMDGSVRGKLSRMLKFLETTY